MARNFPDWLNGYLEYSSHTEPPSHMRFWAGVSAIAGALERKVWIDQQYFRWYPNFYILLVAPPGVVSKSTTAGVAMSLLRQVPGVQFGPDIVTWQSLVTGFAAAKKEFNFGMDFMPMCAMTLESSELGNLLDPSDREMVDLFVSLWDGKQGEFKKETKTSGNDSIVNPWINVIACTTPSWIAGSFPEYMIGGGFTSRCIFVYADKKRELVAYPIKRVPPNIRAMEKALVEDLIEIHEIKGEYRLTDGAYAWGTQWYETHNTTAHPTLGDDRFGGYLARKQTHIHKLAMVLAAATSNDRWITEQHLSVANDMVTDLEPDMAQVFNRIGRTTESMNVERLMSFIQRAGKVEWVLAYRQFHKLFPREKEYEAVLSGLLRSKQILMVQEGPKIFLTAP